MPFKSDALVKRPEGGARANIHANGSGARLRGNETLRNNHRPASFLIIVTVRILPPQDASSRFVVDPLSFALCFRMRTKQVSKAKPYFVKEDFGHP